MCDLDIAIKRCSKGVKTLIVDFKLTTTTATCS